METCMLLCFHVHIFRKNMYVSIYLVLTFDPTGKGSICVSRLLMRGQFAGPSGLRMGKKIIIQLEHSSVLVSLTTPANSNWVYPFAGLDYI